MATFIIPDERNDHIEPGNKKATAKALLAGRLEELRVAIDLCRKVAVEEDDTSFLATIESIEFLTKWAAILAGKC